MALSIKTLDSNYMNHDVQGSISKNDPNKNISNLQIKIKDDKLYINWEDSNNANWKRNVITKASSHIPTDALSGNLIEVIQEKNKYSTKALIDNDIVENKLYCYRIFTEFSNSDKFYSGYKNIFFVYVYNSEEGNGEGEGGEGGDKDIVIKAGDIIVDENHMFITIEQMQRWDNYKSSIDYLNSVFAELNDKIKNLTNNILTELNNIKTNISTNSTNIKNINNEIESLKNNISTEINDIKTNIANINNKIESLNGEKIYSKEGANEILNTTLETTSIDYFK